MAFEAPLEDLGEFVDPTPEECNHCLVDDENARANHIVTERDTAHSKRVVGNVEGDKEGQPNQYDNFNTVVYEPVVKGTQCLVAMDQTVPHKATAAVATQLETDEAADKLPCKGNKRCEGERDSETQSHFKTECSCKDEQHTGEHERQRSHQHQEEE